MDDKLNAERLRALDAAATAGPWAYRPELHDDWGVVRAGRYWICQAKNPEVWSDDQLAQHRAARTDPWQGNAELIACLRNAVPSILTMVEDNARATEPRPFDEWAEDYSDVLWHLMPIHEAPFCGTPHDSTWPYAIVDEPRLWWTPLPNCNEINRRWAARRALAKENASA